MNPLDPADPLAALPVAPPTPPPRAPAPANHVKYAGAMLVVNAIFVVAEYAVTQASGASDGKSVVPPVLPCLIDLGIGASLVSGNVKYRSLAIVRIVLGAILYGVINAQKGDMITVVMQVVLSASLLAMLVGEPGSGRRGLAWTGFGLVVALEALGLFAIQAGTNPLAKLLASTRKDLTPIVGRAVSGNAFKYHLAVGSDDWFLRTDAEAKKDNPLADRWLVLPADDVHVMVLAEPLREAIPLEALVQAVIANAANVGPDYRLIDDKPLAGREQEARLVHFKTKAGGIEIEEIIAVFTDGKRVLQVTTFAAPRAFATHEAELRKIIDSFQLD